MTLGLDKPRFRLNLAEYDQEIAELGERFSLKVDPRAKIWQLSVGEQQRVELLKMLYRGAEVLIMDEPTAVLAPQEIEGLFEILRSMVAEGKSIIFISHKLGEITDIAEIFNLVQQYYVHFSNPVCMSYDMPAITFFASTHFFAMRGL